jgi:hypothetical protein
MRNVEEIVTHAVEWLRLEIISGPVPGRNALAGIQAAKAEAVRKLRTAIARE